MFVFLVSKTNKEALGKKKCEGLHVAFVLLQVVLDAQRDTLKKRQN